MSFRGINTTVIQIRRQVFTEVARMAYANVKGEQANHLMRKIPYTIIPGEEGKLRKDIFLERAIVEERVRLAMGLPTRRMDEHNSVVSGLEDASIADKYYDPPLVNVIKFACNRCPEKLVKVSDLCQGCLAHPCMEVCPKKAITWESGRSTIDQDKCIKCGRCVDRLPLQRHRQDRASLRRCLRHGCHPLRRAGPRRDRLQQVRVLRPVSGQLPLRCHCRQGPDLSADSGLQPRRPHLRAGRSRLHQPVPGVWLLPASSRPP